jgi:hypothetical protein
MMNGKLYSLKKLAFIFFITPCMTAPMASQPNQPLILKHIKKNPDELFIANTHDDFKYKPVRQICALLEQDDAFSCGYRTFFHAKCLDLAIQRVRDGIPLNSSLKELLRNKGILNQIHANIKKFLDTHRTTFDQTTGIDVTHIPGICFEALTPLHGNILPLMLEDDEKTITVLHDSNANPDHPLCYTQAFIEHCGSEKRPYQKCKKIIDDSRELNYQLSKLDKPHSIVHFACRYPKHLFLASIITDQNNKATLYVIDSNNNPMHERPQINTIVTKLLAYVDQHNNKNKRQKII